jgi:phosphatidylserine/phosphatidylglycerophosphate/cardiolipin synthase-like enzyme/uncharacterized membrane protein YdjX (TVP38/TMEM64 family)
MPARTSLSPADYPDTAGRLLRPGSNCWRIEHAQRFAMLVDAAPYFRAVREAIVQARHSIFILSWDIDSRLRLIPDGAKDGFPDPLGDFLHAVVAARPELHAYVLNWDYAMLYALEREWLPAYKLDWRTHRRLQFRMDGRHPVGGSHHQKIVVIDDKIAFVGGLDPTRCRWDTPEHAPRQPLRRDSDGKPYAPFHDVQALVDGDAARALGELARERWHRATGRYPAAPRASDHDPWPASVQPDIREIDIAISRTEPAFEDLAGVHEVRQLHLDAIAAARRYLFFENQYFTSGLIADALGKRLAEPDGPEVMIISPQTQSGWLEQATMGVLRARVHRRLKDADRFRRYRMYCPHIPGLDDACLNVHSKVFAVDDTLFSIGSANLSSRSMAADTECNLTIEASGPPAQRERIARAIAHLRNRLLAEHLDTEPEHVAATLRGNPGLHAAVRSLSLSERRLKVMDPVAPPELDPLILDQAIFDPEKPIKPDEFVAEFVPHEARKPLPRRFIGVGLFALALAALALAWRWTPLREWANLDAMVSFAQHLDDLPFTPLAVMGSFVVAGLLVVPVMLLIAVTGIVFGAVQGTLYAFGGTLLSAAVTYGIGHWLGRDAVQRLLGPRINKLSQRLGQRGIVAMVIVRLLPIAPFSVVNVVAGATHIRFRDYMIGTGLGMLPGIVTTVTFVHHLAQTVHDPSPASIGVLGAVGAALIAAAFGVQRMLRHKEDRAA